MMYFSWSLSISLWQNNVDESIRVRDWGDLCEVVIWCSHKEGININAEVETGFWGFGVRLGLSHSEAEKVLKRLDDAFDQVCDVLKDDQRYRDDALLTRIKDAVYAADQS